MQVAIFLAKKVDFLWSYFFVLVINYLFSEQVKILSEKGGLFWKLFCFNDNSKYILLWTGGFLLVVLVSNQ